MDPEDADWIRGDLGHPEQEHSDPRQGSRKQAWMGWGPAAAEPARHTAAGWDWDDHLLAYTASGPREFTCNCGQAHPAVGYSNCKCGKIWNGYVIGTGGGQREAAAEKFLMREIPARRDVIVASKRDGLHGDWKTSRQRKALTLGIPQGGYDWETEATNETPWPSEHLPAAGSATMKQEPDDWHHREKGKFTPGHKAGPGAFQKKDV